MVEDAAEAHGATIGDRLVGSIGPHRDVQLLRQQDPVTTGEGGMVTTNDAELDAYVRLFRGQGQDPERRYWFPVVGYNYRMTNVAAAIGLAQCECFAEHLADRRRVGDAYDKYLSDLDGRVQLPITRSWIHQCSLALHRRPVRRRRSLTRDEIITALATDGIESRPVFYSMHQLPPYRDAAAKMPVSERLSANGISLPTHGHLTDDDIGYIAERFRAYVT